MTTMVRLGGALFVMLALGITLCAGANAQVLGTPAAEAPATAVVYLTIANTGDDDDRLLSARTDAAESVEVHESVEDGGVVRMEPRPDGIAIPSGGEVRFDAGGLHLMLIGLTADLRSGDGYDLNLRFETAGEVSVPVQVRFTAEADDDGPLQEPVEIGDLTISNAWSRPAPALLGAATPAPNAAPGLDTPVTVDGLTVVLTADRTTSGPRDLTIFITDGAGNPVTDAAVTTNTNSLVMDHGVSTRETEMIEPGRYAIDNVPMGMGGDWQAEINIARPGAEVVVVVFIVTLDGP